MCEFCERKTKSVEFKKVFSGAKADVYQGKELGKWMQKIVIHICPQYSECCCNHEHYQMFPLTTCLYCGEKLN